MPFGPDIPVGVDRRHFLKLAASAAAATGLAPGAFGAGTLLGQERAPTATGQEAPPPVPLGNGEPPAFAFQAYPGGTGSLLEKMWREGGGSPFERSPFEVEPWSGPVPGAEEDVAFLPVHRLAALIRARHISPTELTEIYLERMKRYDPVLLCAVTILEGRGRIDEDAEVVRRMRAAGAVLIAKLSTGEFAQGDQWYRGRTNNPWNLEQGSSGSSAGPSSATAAACVAFGIGTETQGSITSPARRCGLSALRPTFGRVSRHGGMVLAWSMDKVGPICRSIEDCALVFNTIHGADEKDPSTLTTPFRFQRNPDLSALRIGFDEDAPEAFVEALRALGANPQPISGIPRGSSNALNVESAAAFDFHIAPQIEAEEVAAAEIPPEEVVAGGAPSAEDRRRARFRGGREVSALDYLQSQRRRHLLMEEMAKVMEDFDMFVSGRGEIGLTNQTGHPAVVVPYDFGGDNPQPLTTTITGGLFADDKILSVAHAYQRSTDWHLRRPDLTGIA